MYGGDYLVYIQGINILNINILVTLHKRVNMCKAVLTIDPLEMIFKAITQ